MQPTLTCDVRRQADAVVIVAEGELDLTTSGVLENAADEALAPAPGRLVLDFSRLTFVTRSECHCWSGVNHRDLGR